MDEAKQKRKLLLDLNDTENTARICNALSSKTRLDILRCLVEHSMTISDLAKSFYLPMSSISLHVKTLKDAGLISVTSKPGLRGSQKLCGIQVSNIDLDLFSHVNKINQVPPVTVNMPVGHYSSCAISPPCGLASVNSYLYEEDSPYGFYSENRTEASLVWFTSGYLEYHFSNQPLLTHPVSQIEFSFEICSEAPGYNNNWPSDITLELNHHCITTFRTKGDYGGRKGIYNPSWWSESITQFGEYKKVLITHDGCFLNGQPVSDATLDTLRLTDGYFFSFTLRVDPDSQCVGGMNLFGKDFGDYAQDIVMKVEYQNV